MNKYGAQEDLKKPTRNDKGRVLARGGISITKGRHALSLEVRIQARGLSWEQLLPRVERAAGLRPRKDWTATGSPSLPTNVL